MTTILIIDDSDTVRAQLRKDLADRGFGVLEAGNGVEGLQIIAEKGAGIGLIICDVNMPELDGLAMCREMQNTPGMPHIPVIMLTTQTGAEMKAEGKQAGVTAWVVKPYEKTRLLTGIARILGDGNAGR